MNIQPCKSQCVPVPSKPAAKAAKPANEPATPETPKAARHQKLLAALSEEPGVRAQEIERGKALAADPDYPSKDLLAKLAEVFVNDARRIK